MRPILPLLGLVLLGATSCSICKKSDTVGRSGPGPTVPDLVQYAKPMCGTGEAQGTSVGGNDCFPGATLPFGMIQWSPDTEEGRRESGYADRDKRISDFSVDHISGAGCGYGEDFAMMPIL